MLASEVSTGAQGIVLLLTVSIICRDWMRDHWGEKRLCSCMWPDEGADEHYNTPQSPPVWPHASHVQAVSCR